MRDERVQVRLSADGIPRSGQRALSELDKNSNNRVDPNSQRVTSDTRTVCNQRTQPPEISDLDIIHELIMIVYIPEDVFPSLPSLPNFHDPTNHLSLICTEVFSKMVCKFLKKIFRSDHPSRVHQEPSLSDPANLVITHSTINVVGRNQINYDHLYSAPIPGSPVVVDGYYLTTGNPVPYVNVYPGLVYGVANSHVLLSPVIFMNAPGQPVVPSSPSQENQAQHQISPLNNLTACLDDRRALSQHARQTHTPREVSTHSQHPFPVSGTTHLPSYDPIVSNCNCCSRRYSIPSRPDFITGSSTGQTVDREVASHETNLTAHRQSRTYASAPIHFPHPRHDRLHLTHGANLSSSAVPPSSLPSASSHSFPCGEHLSQPGTSFVSGDGMAAEKSLDPCRFEQSSRETSQGSTLHHTVSPGCRLRSHSLGSLPTLPTVSELTRSQSLPNNILPKY